jgi:hypothetical protein
VEHFSMMEKDIVLELAYALSAIQGDNVDDIWR